MKYKLLALDLDGTLLTSDKRITSNTLKIIEEARKKGLKVTLATGRNYLSAKTIAKKLQLDLPIITNDGAYIVNYLDNKVLFEKRLNNETVQEIIEALNRLNLKYMIVHESYSFGNFMLQFNMLNMLFRFFNINTLKALWVEQSNYKIMTNRKINKHIKENKTKPLKIFIHAEPEQTKDMELELEDIFKNEIRVTTSGYGVEILPKEISKASGLEIFNSLLGFDKEEMIAIGDSFNDLEMIKYAGLGIAMGNAPKEIQKHAKFVTRTNDNDGVAYAIEQFVLKNVSSIGSNF